MGHRDLLVTHGINDDIYSSTDRRRDQPVDADSYVIDGETLIFLRSDNELAAFFDISVVVDWKPRLENSTGQPHA
jgi:hypothetical protein